MNLPRPPPRAYALLVNRRPSDLASVVEPWVPTAATCQETLLQDAVQDIIVALITTLAAANGTYHGEDIHRGSTCHTRGQAAVPIAYWPHNELSGAASSFRTRPSLGLSWKLPAPRAAIPLLLVKLLDAQVRRLGKFEGRLAWACSRLGRKASLAVPSSLRRGQFEGTNRCLGRISPPPRLLGSGSTPALRRATR